MFSFKILNANDETCAIVCIDEIDNNIGFVSLRDSELNKILNYIVELPYLKVTTGDKISSSYVEMEEKIGVKDNRFFEVMKSYLNEYKFSKPIKHESKTINDVLNEQKISETWIGVEA